MADYIPSGHKINENNSERTAYFNNYFIYIRNWKEHVERMSFDFKPPHSPKNNTKYPPRKKGTERFCLVMLNLLLERKK
jgi:hypothetical protein